MCAEKQNKRLCSLATAVRKRKTIAHNTSIYLTTHSGFSAKTNHHRIKTKTLECCVFVSPVQKSSVAITEVDESNA